MKIDKTHAEYQYYDRKITEYWKDSHRTEIVNTLTEEILDLVKGYTEQKLLIYIDRKKYEHYKDWSRMTIPNTLTEEIINIIKTYNEQKLLIHWQKRQWT